MEPSRHTELQLLIVEDESLIAMELEDILTDLGHRVLAICSTLTTAMDFVETNAHALDGAIIDANLGGQSARPVAKALEERGVPFLVASGYEGEELRRLGFSGTHIGKPYRPPEIGRAVAASLRRREGTMTRPTSRPLS